MLPLMKDNLRKIYKAHSFFNLEMGLRNTVILRKLAALVLSAIISPSCAVSPHSIKVRYEGDSKVVEEVDRKINPSDGVVYQIRTTTTTSYPDGSRSIEHIVDGQTNVECEPGLRSNREACDKLMNKIMKCDVNAPAATPESLPCYLNPDGKPDARTYYLFDKDGTEIAYEERSTIFKIVSPGYLEPRTIEALSRIYEKGTIFTDAEKKQISTRRDSEGQIIYGFDAENRLVLKEITTVNPFRNRQMVVTTNNTYIEAFQNDNGEYYLKLIDDGLVEERREIHY